MSSITANINIVSPEVTATVQTSTQTVTATISPINQTVQASISDNVTFVVSEGLVPVLTDMVEVAVGNFNEKVVLTENLDW